MLESHRFKLKGLTATGCNLRIEVLEGSSSPDDAHEVRSEGATRAAKGLHHPANARHPDIAVQLQRPLGTCMAALTHSFLLLCGWLLG
jgi:hypothetical protein